VRGRSQTIIAGVGVAVVLVVVFFLLIRPRQNALGDVRDEVAAERDRSQQLEAELERLRALQDNAPQLQAELDRMREFVPGHNDVPNFIFQVQEAANHAGVGFVQITPELPKPPPEGAALAEIRSTIGAKGGYFAVQDFIRRLYDLDRAVRIDNLTMTGVEDDAQAAEEGRVELQLTARIFFELPTGAAAPAPETTAPAPVPAPTGSPAPPS
jgi:Tfp pilus assembly protein PilO